MPLASATPAQQCDRMDTGTHRGHPTIQTSVVILALSRKYFGAVTVVTKPKGKLSLLQCFLCTAHPCGLSSPGFTPAGARPQAHAPARSPQAQHRSPFTPML